MDIYGIFIIDHRVIGRLVYPSPQKHRLQPQPSLKTG